MPPPTFRPDYACRYITPVCRGFLLRLIYQTKKLLNKLQRKLSTGKTFNKKCSKAILVFFFIWPLFCFVCFVFLFCFFLTDRNGRSSLPSGQNGCGSGYCRKRRYVGVYHSSYDVRTLTNHFRNLIPLYQPELAQ